MKKIDNYIVEKLRINKNNNFTLSYPVNVEMWSSSGHIHRVKDDINEYSDINRFMIEDLKKTDEENWHLYRIEVETKSDFIGILQYCLLMIFNHEPFDDLDKIELKRWVSIINNYEDIKEHIESLTKKDLKDLEESYEKYR